jgi:phosphatidylglycerol---prolipoprotein diacylglyceryl transferase
LTGVQKRVLAVAAFLGAMIGAKLPFALSDWNGLWDGTAWFADGKTIVAGLVGGYVAVEFAKWLYGITTKTGDSFVIPIATAIAIGRIGCLQGGCCFGTPTNLPWGMVFPSARDPYPIPRHPTQIYEAIFHLIVVATALGMSRRGMFRYQRFKLYLMAYLVYRFATEFIRPEPRLVAQLTAYQWSSLALAPLVAWLWWRDLPKSLSAPEFDLCQNRDAVPPGSTHFRRPADDSPITRSSPD